MDWSTRAVSTNDGFKFKVQAKHHVGLHEKQLHEACFDKMFDLETEVGMEFPIEK